MWWFWWWLVFLIVLLALPTGYGWGYRRLGPPYPSWTAKAREARASEAATWGVAADLLWVALILMLVWLLVAAVV